MQKPMIGIAEKGNQEEVLIYAKQEELRLG